MFENTIKALMDYENLCKHKPKNYEEEYKYECAAFEISKAFVYDLGYENALKFANAILALSQLHPLE